MIHRHRVVLLRRAQKLLRRADRRTVRAALAVVVVAAAAGLVCAAAASNGPLVTPDGAVYLGTADSLRAGRGLTVPFTTYTDSFDLGLVDDGRIEAPLRTFPPAFPLTIAAVAEVTSVDGLTAARWTNTLLLAVNVLLIGVVTLRLVGVDRWPWACGGLVLVLFTQIVFPGMPGMLELHATVLAEPGMLAAMLTAVLLSARVLQRYSTPSVVAAATAAAVAVAFRFAGIAAVAVVLYAVVRSPACSRAIRWVAVPGVVVAGFAPLAVSMYPSGAEQDPARTILLQPWRPVVAELFGGILGLVTPVHWPLAVRWSLTAAVLLMAAAALPMIRLRRDHAAAAPIADLLGVLGVCSMIVLLTSRLLLDRFIPMGGRLLTPLLVVIVPLAVGAACRIGVRGVALPAILFAAAVSWTGAQALRAVVPIVPGDRVPAGISSAVDELRAIPRSVVIITDAPDGVHLATGRPAVMVPCRDDYFSGAVDESYSSDEDTVLDLVRRRRAVVLLVAPPNPARRCLDRDDAARLGLVTRAEWPGGRLFG